MHRAAGHLGAVVQHGLVDARAVHALAAEGGQQGGVDVHDPPGVGRHDGGGQLPHVARQADQVHPVEQQQAEQGVGVGGLVGPRGDVGGAQAQRAGAGQGGRVGEVAHHADHLARDPALGAGLGDGRHVAAAPVPARQQDRDPCHAPPVRRAPRLLLVAA
jgi:hypothetical protein